MSDHKILILNWFQMQVISCLLMACNLRKADEAGQHADLKSKESDEISEIIELQTEKNQTESEFGNNDPTKADEVFILAPRLSLESFNDGQQKYKCPYRGMYSIIKGTEDEIKNSASNWWKNEQPCKDFHLTTYEETHDLRQCTDRSTGQVFMKTEYDINGMIVEFLIGQYDGSYHIYEFNKNRMLRYIFVSGDGLGIQAEVWENGRIKHYGTMEGWGRKQGIWIYCDIDGMLNKVDFHELYIGPKRNKP